MLVDVVPPDCKCRRPMIVCATPSALSCALRVRSGSPPFQVTRWSATIDRPGSPKMPSRRTWPLSPRRAGPLHDLYAGVGDGPQHRVEGSDASTLAARAAALQTTDPPAAALWAQLDKQLTSLAIWLPTVTPNETGLISRRTGNYQYNSVWGTLLDQL